MRVQAKKKKKTFLVCFTGHSPTKLRPLEQREDGLPSRLNDPTGPREMKKRLMVTEQRLVGMAPSRAKRGDIVCVLYGCRVPVLLRSCGDNYKFIRECYANGFMNGKISDRDLKSKSFALV